MADLARAPQGFCPYCGYAINPGRCSECGVFVASEDLRTNPADRFAAWRATGRVFMALALVATGVFPLWACLQVVDVTGGPGGASGAGATSQPMVLQPPRVLLPSIAADGMPYPEGPIIELHSGDRPVRFSNQPLTPRLQFGGAIIRPGDFAERNSPVR